jgi:signal transduction histidine kinase
MSAMTHNSTIGVVLLCLSLCCPDKGAAAEPKKVLLLHSFGANLQNATGIRAELERQWPEPLEIFNASFATARPTDENVASRYADYLRALFANQRPDLAVAIGSPSARFFQQYRQQLFPSTPMLMMIEERALSSFKLTANDTAVLTSVDLAGVIRNILQVLPDTANIAVVIGSSPIEQYWIKQMRTAFLPFAGRVSFIWFDDLSLSEMLKRASELPPRSAIFFFLLLTDAAGAAHEEESVFSRLHATANAPIFSYSDANFGRGIVGGPLGSVEDRSRQVAGAAVRILRGETPGSIQIPPITFSTPKFDWRETQRWGISESRLPPGSEIHFRDRPLWERYRMQILVVCFTLLAQTALIAWLIYEHRRRQLAEVLARNSLADLTHLNRMATAGELSASIAHEVNQPLTGIVTRASAALRWLRRDRPDLAKAEAALEQIVAGGQRASDIVKSVRTMFKKDAQIGLVDINKVILMVLQLLRIELRKWDVEVQTQLDDLPPVAGDMVQLQQLVLNLVANAIDAMHAVTPRVLCLKSELNASSVLHVSIEDTGTGIDPSTADEVFKPLFTTKRNGMGMGLAICKSIVETHNGRMWITAAAGRGTIFHIELPTGSRGATPS